MPVHEHDAGFDQLVGDGYGLFGVTGVVLHDVGDLFAEHAAFGVDVGHRLVRAGLQLHAESGVGASERAGDADLGLRLGGARVAEGGDGHRAEKDFSQSCSPC